MSLHENIRDEVIKTQFIGLKAVTQELIAENAAAIRLKEKVDLKDKHIYCLEQEMKELHMKLKNFELAQAQLINDKKLLQDDRDLLAKQLKEERDFSIMEMKMKTCNLAKNQPKIFNGSVKSKIMAKYENENLCKMQAEAKIKHLNGTNENKDEVISKQQARIEQLEMENSRLSSAIVDLKNMHVEKDKRNKKKIDEFKFEIFSLKEKNEEIQFKYQKEKEEYTKKTADKIKVIKKQSVFAFQEQENVSEKPEELNLQNIKENAEKPQLLKKKKKRIMCEETENNEWNPQKKRLVWTRQCSEDSPSAEAHF